MDKENTNIEDLRRAKLNCNISEEQLCNFKKKYLEKYNPNTFFEAFSRAENNDRCLGYFVNSILSDLKKEGIKPKSSIGDNYDYFGNGKYEYDISFGDLFVILGYNFNVTSINIGEEDQSLDECDRNNSDFYLLELTHPQCNLKLQANAFGAMLCPSLGPDVYTILTNMSSICLTTK